MGAGLWPPGRGSHGLPLAWGHGTNGSGRNRVARNRWCRALGRGATAGASTLRTGSYSGTGMGTTPPGSGNQLVLRARRRRSAGRIHGASGAGAGGAKEDKKQRRQKYEAFRVEDEDENALPLIRQSLVPDVWHRQRHYACTPPQRRMGSQPMVTSQCSASPGAISRRGEQSWHLAVRSRLQALPGSHPTRTTARSRPPTNPISRTITWMLQRAKGYTERRHHRHYRRKSGYLRPRTSWCQRCRQKVPVLSASTAATKSASHERVSLLS